MTLAEQLIRDEREILHAYPDSEGYWTIGVGRLIDCRRGGGISHDEALFLLQNDVMRVTSQLAETFPWTQVLDDARRGVLLNMAFNLGIHGLAEFRMMLGAAEQADWETAAQEMLNSEWAAQVGGRAVRLAQQMRTGQWV